jgi:hypothetical protein
MCKRAGGAGGAKKKKKVKKKKECVREIESADPII